MPSSYTSLLRFELPVQGELTGSWGNVVNTAITTPVSEAIAGTTSITVGGSDYVLSNGDGSSANEARRMFITATGTPGAARNVICPATSKLYVFTNNTTGGFAMTLKTLSGTGIAVPAGQRRLLYCNGTDVVEAINGFSSVTVDAGTVSAPSYTFSGDTNTGMWSPGADALAWSTGGTEKLRLDASGNLGLGQTPSAWGAGYTALQIKSGGAALWSDGLQRLFLSANVYYDGANRLYQTTGTAAEYVQNGGQHLWYTAPSGTAGNAISFTQAMTLDASGNLGIGTTLPGYKLEVVGPSNSYAANFRTNSGTAANDAGILFINASSATAASRSSQIVLDPNGANGIGGDYTYLLMTGDGTFTLGNQFDGALVFSGATERMRLDASGNLGIGTTPSAWNAAFKGVELNNGAFLATTNGPYLTYNAYFSSNWLYKTNAAASHYLQTGGEHHWYNAPSGTAGNLITFTQAMTLDLSGRLGIGTTSPGANLQLGASTSGSQVLALAYSATSAGSIDFRANGSAFGAGWIQHDAASGALRFATAGSERMRITSAGNVVAGASAALATTATDGFLYVPTCAGTPTGTPTTITGMAPIVVNTTNNKLYFYSGGAWRDAGP